MCCRYVDVNNSSGSESSGDCVRWLSFEAGRWHSCTLDEWDQIHHQSATAVRKETRRQVWGGIKW